MKRTVREEYRKWMPIENRLAYMFTYNGNGTCAKWVSGKLGSPRSTGKSSCFHSPFGGKSTRFRHTQLVGGFNTSEKYEFVSWDDYSQDMEK